MRGVGFLLIALIIFAPFNFIAIRQLLRTHPRRKAVVIALAIAGNLMWPFLLLLRQSTPFMRVTRATLGPLWFGWQSFAIVYTAITLLLFLAWLTVRRRMTFARFARWPSRVILSLAVVGTVAGFYHALVPLRVERVPIFINNLPAAAEGTRLALMSDLHVGLFTRPSRLTKIFRTARELSPDAVLLAGDLIDDDPFFVPKLLAGTPALDPSIPILAVLGNHEMYGAPDAVVARMRGSRIRLLVNEGHAVNSVWIAGVSDYAASAPAFKPSIDHALRNAPASSIPVLLSHQPKAFDDAQRRSLPLTLAGHTHGGQLGFRPLRWSLAGVFLDEHMGLYRKGASQLYINTGTGYWLLPFRLGMTPEITLIELRRAN
jgi:predicted MPP superfamily phosphohydrolase